MPAVHPRQPMALLDCGVGAVVLLAASAGMPLGLDATGAGPLLAGGHALGGEGAGAAARSPLAAMVIRLAACLPIGDLPTRAHLASAALAALAAVLLARVVAEALAATAGPDRAEGAAGHQLLAAGAGALLPIICLNGFRPLTTTGATALALALLAAGWLRVARLLRAPGRARDGLTLAFLTGLVLVAEPVVGVLLGPLAAGVWVRSFRRGDRWALLAPALLAAGLTLTVFAQLLATEAGLARPPTLGARIAALFPSGLGGAVSPTDDLVAEMGVLAGLVALAGFVVLTLRLPLLAGLVMGSAVLAMAMHADGGAAVGSTAWVALLAVLSVPLALGITHLGGKLGPARAAAAAVIAVLALVGPALDGGAARFRRSTLLPEALLREAHAEIGPGLRVDPGSPPMRALLGYGQALGLRPDLTLAPARPAGRLPALAARRSVAAP